MGLEDKISNKAEELRGKAKEAVGKLTDNDDLKAQGAADQVSAAVKGAGDKLKDAAHNLKEKLTDKEAEEGQTSG